MSFHNDDEEIIKRFGGPAQTAAMQEKEKVKQAKAAVKELSPADFDLVGFIELATDVVNAAKALDKAMKALNAYQFPDPQPEENATLNP